MTVAILVLAALSFAVLLRILWLTQDTHWHIEALYEKVGDVDFDVRYIHGAVVPPGQNPRYPRRRIR